MDQIAFDSGYEYARIRLRWWSVLPIRELCDLAAAFLSLNDPNAAGMARAIAEYLKEKETVSC